MEFSFLKNKFLEVNFCGYEEQKIRYIQITEILYLPFGVVLKFRFVPKWVCLNRYYSLILERGLGGFDVLSQMMNRYVYFDFKSWKADAVRKIKEMV